MNKKKLLAVISAAVVFCGSMPIAGKLLPQKLEAYAAADTANIFEDESLSEYHISTAQELVDFNNSNLDFQGKKVYLDADIDMEGIDWTPKDFYGYFDGQYHSIKNISINKEHNRYHYTTRCGGLFLNNYGIVYRVNLENYSISAISLYFAELISDSESSPSDAVSYDPANNIYYCNDAVYAGGICCLNQGKIYGCIVNGTYSIEREFENCSGYEVGNYYKGEYTGDICAENKGEIVYCTAKNNICDTDLSSGTIKNCEPDYKWTHNEADAVDFTDDIADIGKLIISPETLNIYVGESEWIHASINDRPVEASYYVTDSNIAEMDYYYFNDFGGRINGRSAGNTKVMITYGNQIGYVDVHVSEMGELVVSPETINLMEGESQEISVTVNNESVKANCSVTDRNIAEINNNIIKGKNFGDTQIKVSFNNQTKYIDVHVNGNIKNIPADDFSDMTADEFRITSAEGMLAFAEACKSNSFSDKTVYLDADIDMTDKGYVAPDYFYGTFDGRYHTITGLKATVGYNATGYDYSKISFNSTSEVYDCIGGGFVNRNYGKILRLNLDSIDISAISYTLGAPNPNDYNKYAYLVYINAYAGGICGENNGDICGCTVTGKIETERIWSPVASWDCHDTCVVNGICAKGNYSYCSSNAVNGEKYEAWKKAEVNELYPCKYTLTEQEVVKGDVDYDGVFKVNDVVLLQKWLLAVPDTKLKNWKAADLYEDNKLDVFDLCLMKRELLNQ